ERARFLITGLLSASGDTTSGSLLWTLCYLAEYPDVQRKAQILLDDAFGQLDGPPTFDSEREQAEAWAYIRAIVKEQSRLSPVSPTNGPRRCDADDVYKGVLIPKGSIVFINAGHILRDARVYDEPLRFKPERWLEADNAASVGDLLHDVWPFGFGRRGCPGIYLATQALPMALMHILLNFNI
ncbi:cytochrome P450, partial [Ceraceosorus guamensis]